MNRGLKIGGLVVLLLGAGVGAYFLFRKDEGDSPTPGPSKPSSTKYKNNDFPLKKNSGDTGQSVKRVSSLQRYLNDVGDYGLAVDGKFGPKTLTAVQTHIGSSEVSEAYYNENVKPFEDASYTTPADATIPISDDSVNNNAGSPPPPLPEANLGFSGKGRGQVRSQNCTTANLHNCLGAGYNSCSQDGADADADCYCSNDASGPAWGDCNDGRIKETGKRTGFINANGTWFDDLEVGY